jgi:hypothetical protein
MVKNGVYGGNVEIITISGIYEVFVSICFVPESQITEEQTVLIG